MTIRPTSARPTRRWLVAVVGSVLLAGSGCGAQDAPPREEDAPLEEPGPEVDGGAVGPDVQVTDDIGLQQVQLEYPEDGLYEEGESARVYFAVANSSGEPAVLTDISGPDFSGVEVETADGSGLPLTADPNDDLYVGAEGPPTVTLLDLGRSLRSSQSIPVTFTFAEAGEVTVDVVVSAEGQTPSPPFDFPNDDPDQDPTDDEAPAPAAPSLRPST
jgi:hypothetical protein